MKKCAKCNSTSKRVALDCTFKDCSFFEESVDAELLDKALTIMQLLANATGATFEDENLAADIIVETFKNL